MMMMKSVIWWRKPEYPEETTDLRQVTDETVHTYGLFPVRGLNLGRSGVKQTELRRDESDALAHRATAVNNSAYYSHGSEGMKSFLVETRWPLGTVTVLARPPRIGGLKWRQGAFRCTALRLLYRRIK